MEITKTGVQTLGSARVRRQTYNDAIATEVRVQVARLDITQAELGQAIGLDQSGMSRRMKGTTPFRADELAAIASLLGCSVHELLPSAYDGDVVDELRASKTKAPIREDRGLREVLPRLDSNQQPSD